MLRPYGLKKAVMKFNNTHGISRIFLDTVTGEIYTDTVSKNDNAIELYSKADVTEYDCEISFVDIETMIDLQLENIMQKGAQQ